MYFSVFFIFGWGFRDKGSASSMQGQHIITTWFVYMQVLLSSMTTSWQKKSLSDIFFAWGYLWMWHSVNLHYAPCRNIYHFRLLAKHISSVDCLKNLINWNNRNFYSAIFIDKNTENLYFLTLDSFCKAYAFHSLETNVWTELWTWMTVSG